MPKFIRKEKRGFILGGKAQSHPADISLRNEPPDMRSQEPPVSNPPSDIDHSQDPGVRDIDDVINQAEADNNYQDPEAGPLPRSRQQREAGQDQNGDPSQNRSAGRFDSNRAAMSAPQRVQTRKTPPATQVPEPPKMQNGQDPSHDINPAANPTKGVKGKFAQGLQALATGNKGKLATGGGIGAFIFAVILFASSPLLADLKLSTFMENMYRHGFRHVTHGYVARQRLIVKYWLKEQIEPGFKPDAAVVNYERSMFKNLYGKLRGDDKIRKQLEQAGFNIKTVADPDYPNGGRITTIRYQGHEMRNGTFEAEYRYMFEPGNAAERAAKGNLSHDISLIADDALKGNKITKRLASRRLQIMTGAKLHWIDKLTGPFEKIRQRIFNEVVTFIYEHSPLNREAVAQFLSVITGEKIDKATADKIAAEQAARGATAGAAGELGGEAAARTFTSALTETLGKVGFDVSNPIGWAAIIITGLCKMNSMSTDGYERLALIAKLKTGAEYGIQFIAMESSRSQVHDSSDSSNTDTIMAMVEMLNDKQNRDFSLSNNYQRAAGGDKPFVHTDDCTSGVELCDSMRPQTMVDNNFIGQSLKRMQDDPFGNNFFAKYVTFLGPHGVLTGPMCSAIDYVFKLATTIPLLSIIKLTNPALVAEFTGFISKGFQPLIDHVFMPVLAWIIPPVVNADTRGPKLANAVAAGALDMAGTFMRGFCGFPMSFDVAESKKCQLNGADLVASEDAIHRESVMREQSRPFLDRVASLDNPRSLISRMVMDTPTTPRQMMGRLASFSQLLYIPNLAHAIATNVPSLISGTAVAGASTDEPTGVDIYGYSETCLSNPELNNGTNPDCKGMDKFDTSAACAMLAGQTEGKDMPAECNEGLDANGSAYAPDAHDTTISRLGGMFGALSKLFSPVRAWQ